MNMNESQSVPDNGKWFSPKQRKVIAAALTSWCAVSVIACAILILWLIGRFLSSISIVLTPLLVALILTLLFQPYYVFLHRRLDRKPNSYFVSLAVFFISVAIPLVFIIGSFGSLIVSQLLALIEYLPTLIEKSYHACKDGIPAVNNFIAKYGLESKLPILTNPQSVIAAWLDDISIGSVGIKAMHVGVGTAKYLISLFAWLIIPVYLCYLLPLVTVKGDGIVKENVKFLWFCKTETKKEVAGLIGNFINILVAYFRGQVIIVLIESAIFGICFWLIGLPYGLILGIMLGLLNLIPYLGNAIGLSVTLPMAILGEGGSLLRLALVLTVFCIVQFLEGYVLTPKIQKKWSGLSDVQIIFSLLFWGVVFNNILGILLAIPLSAFLKVLWIWFRKKKLAPVI